MAKGFHRHRKEHSINARKAIRQRGDPEKVPVYIKQKYGYKLFIPALVGTAGQGGIFYEAPSHKRWAYAQTERDARRYLREMKE